MTTCPDCGTPNDDDARFCDNCGRRLDDVPSDSDPTTEPEPDATAPVDDPPSAPLTNDGMPLADDGLPVGRDLDGVPGGERIVWEGRPSRLWSPRMSLMNRYKLTTQRLIVEFGFIGKTTEEIELYRVTDVGVKQHPLERITQMGDVYIASGDASTPVKYLHNVPDPDRVKDLIREATRQERERRRVFLREEF